MADLDAQRWALSWALDDLVRAWARLSDSGPPGCADDLEAIVGRFTALLRALDDVDGNCPHPDAG